MQKDQPTNKVVLTGIISSVVLLIFVILFALITQ
jgi:hypothetical protein